MYAFDALYNGEISNVKKKKIVMSHMSVPVLFGTASIPRGVLSACRCTD